MKISTKVAFVPIMALSGLLLMSGCGPSQPAKTAKDYSAVIAAAQESAKVSYVIQGTSWFSVGSVADADEALPVALYEFKDVTWTVLHNELSEADKLNGVSESGNILFTYQVYRRRDPNKVWGQWLSGPGWSTCENALGLFDVKGSLVWAGSFTIQNAQLKVTASLIGIRHPQLPIQTKNGDLEVPEVKQTASTGFDYSAIK
jgi:hypothetical protein